MATRTCILVGEAEVGGQQCLKIARVLRNDDGLLVEDVAQTQRLVGVYFGDVGWADYNGDGDLAIAGWDDDAESVRLYANDPGTEEGERLLTLDVTQVDELGTSTFTGVRYADLSWADFDNDGDGDLVVTGMEKNGTSLTQFYRNKGGSLSVDETNSEAMINVHNGDLAWADYDNDGDLDLALSGENVVPDDALGRITEFYRNSPIGSLDVDPTVSAASVVKGGALAWADYDTDGNLDLAVTGRDVFWEIPLQLYRNRPAGTLSIDEGFSLNRFLTLDGELAWVDYDNDGDPDLAVSGRTILSSYRAQVFENRDGTVTAAVVEDLDGLAGGATLWGDYDGDGRVDLLITGVDEAGARRSILHSNRGTPNANREPTAPASLNEVEVTSGRALFSWSAGQDIESAALSYNIRIGTEPGSGDIFSATVPLGAGNAGLQTSFSLQRSLAPDRYFWSVQAVDGGFARSEFTADGEFRVEQFVSSDQQLRNLQQSSMAWGDIDDDGDPDLALMGRNRSGDPRSLIYVNQNRVLTLDIEAGITPLRNGDVAWGDV